MKQHKHKYLIRFAEIALKGKNRPYFQNLLIKNIKETLEHFEIKNYTITKTWSRIFLTVNSPITHSNKSITTQIKPNDTDSKTREALSKIAGIHSFSLIKETTSTLDTITQTIAKQLNKHPKKQFNLNINRADKNFPLTSPEIIQQLVKKLKAHLDQLNYNSPNNINIDLRKKATYIYTGKQRGLGGLPKGSEGKAISLLSGGMDSPVATILAIKRGLHIDCVHLDMTNDSKYLKKIRILHKELQKYDPTMKLYIIDYTKYRDHLLKKLKTNEKRYSCVLCKRGMLKIAQKIAVTRTEITNKTTNKTKIKEKTKSTLTQQTENPTQISAKSSKKTGNQKQVNAIVTGENLGQVASQTLSNMNTITSSDILILRPLLTYDKEEIATLMKQLKLDKVANIKTDYTCPLLPPNPATRSIKNKIKQIEKRIESEKILNEIIQSQLHK